MDLQIFGDSAGIMDGEQEIQVLGGIQGSMYITSRAGKDSKSLVIEGNKFRQKGIGILVIIDI